MIGRILDLSVRFRWAVIALVTLVAALGVYNPCAPADRRSARHHQQAGADQHRLGDPGPGRGGKARHLPGGDGHGRIPGLEPTCSISRNGFSQVTIVFKEKTDIYFARQQVAERLTQVRQSLPAGAEPAMGPISSGLGEVLMWTVAYEHPAGRAPRSPTAPPVGIRPTCQTKWWARVATSRSLVSNFQAI